METVTQNGTEGLGLGVLTLSAGDVKHIKQLIKPLTGVKPERVVLIYQMYGDVAVDIVNHFSGKHVPNQWADFLKDARQVNNPDDPSYTYFKALTAAFELTQPVDSIDILIKVMQTRDQCGLEPLGKDSINAAIDDFGIVFLYDKVQDEEDDTIYTPVLKKQVK